MTTTIETLPAWASLDEHDKRQHLAWKHGYVPAEYGGWEPIGPEDDQRGSDAWVLDGKGTVSELDELHADDHAMYEHGGGRFPHAHRAA